MKTVEQNKNLPLRLTAVDCSLQ